MKRRKRLWLAAALAVAVVLAGPAAPAHAATGSPLLDRVWGWLAAVLPWAPQAQATACDWGSHIDPNGGCRAAAVQPNGRSAASADWGSSIDPNGQSTPGPDWGGYIDPNG